MGKNETCRLCGGGIDSGVTTFTVDYGSGVLVVRHVPALVCAQCGESWIEDPVAARLEEMLQDAKHHHRQIEVIDIAA